MTKRLLALIACAALLLSGGLAAAEGTDVSFGSLKGDPTLPVEVKADSLSVDQATGSAAFSGNVMVTQGQMKLSADTVTVEYGPDKKKIATLHASGNVLLVNATDAAKGDAAVYTVDSGTIVLTGNVLLTQGQAAISGGELTVDLRSGTGRMSGGVTTTFVPASGGN